MRHAAKQEVHMKRKTVVTAAAAALIIALLAAAFCPVVHCEADIPKELLQAVKSQAKGFYSARLPLAAVYVSVNSFDGIRVYYTVYYFPLGSVGMSYSESDGYNMEKPLLGM